MKTIGLWVWMAVVVSRSTAAEMPHWVAPMKSVHSRFNAEPGTLAHFGDSITVTMAYWAPVGEKPKNMDAATAQAQALVKSYLKPQCWRAWKGAKFGSEGSMTVRWAHAN